MCGIVGYIGRRDAEPILLEGLHRLEYRGYDSAGLATLAFLTLAGLAMLTGMRRVRRLGDRLSYEGQQNCSVFIDSVNGCRAVRAFGSEDYVIGRYQHWIDRYESNMRLMEDAIRRSEALSPPDIAQGFASQTRASNARMIELAQDADHRSWRKRRGKPFHSMSFGVSATAAAKSRP